MEAMTFNTLLFVKAVSCCNGTQNISLSVVGFQNIPKAFITLSFPMFNSKFLSTFQVQDGLVVLDD